jgi:hypothetical protein
MNDPLTNAVRGALRDIIAAAPVADRHPMPVDLVDAVRERPRRGAYVAIAAALVIALGLAAIVARESRRSGPSSSSTASDNSSGRLSGEITDPRAIDFSPWLIGAPEWPGFQPEYLVFDIDALAGWNKLSESGGHQIGDGWAYAWAAEVRDPDGHEFVLTISDSFLYPRDFTGDTVDINGVVGTVGSVGSVGEGEVAWLLDTSHFATVTDPANVGNERALALARRLTTTTVTSISVGRLGRAPEIAADPTAPVAGFVDGIEWSASATAEELTFTIDRTISQIVIIDPQQLRSASEVAITQFGYSDLCVFIAGYLTESDTTVRLVLSDATTIGLPTQPLENGESWFAACLPYALDATAVETDSLNSEPISHRLNWPLLRPSLGQVAADTVLTHEGTAAFVMSLTPGNDCGAILTDELAMVAWAPRADGNSLELWVAPTSNGGSAEQLISFRHNGAALGASGGCGGDSQSGWAGASSDLASGEIEGIIDIYGQTDPTASDARVTFTSGKVVIAAVQTDGYFISSFIDVVSSYSEVETVEPVY